MATRPIAPGRRIAKPDWRAVLKRSLRRAGELSGALVLFAGMVFLALALVSYHQTDPSTSTAAGGDVQNWMGVTGAWTAERALFLFGPVSALFVPLLYVFGRKLWLLVEEDDGEVEHTDQRWWVPVGVLALSMLLIATVLSLWFTKPGGTLPASMGGISGLLGAKAITALAGLAPEAAHGGIKFALAVICLGLGLVLAGRVFAFDWARLLTLPGRIGRLPISLPSAEDLPFKPGKEKQLRAERAEQPEKAEAPLRAAEMPAAASAPARKAPEISAPKAAPIPAQFGSDSRQKDMFDKYELPSLDLLADPAPNSQPKIDKLSLERNARLLETVLDDFNVKGEITAVRTGPVVTMYELEPAPGIKASRVIGLADDIARNMSAISARVSSIPGRTVMGIELPNANRQMVSFKEMVASEAFAHHKGMLPIILGKDIAGEPVVADLATMPHLLVAGTTGSGKSVGLNAILLSLLYRLTPAQCRLILVDPKVLELKSYDDIPHLLSPVVTEPPKAIRALKWAVEEMERRYRQMSEISVRNLASFNEKVRTAAAKGKPLGRRIQIGFDPETGEELYEDRQLDYEALPQIVLIVDELADLMVTVGKEIEVLIQRLSQKSRAAGIHLIMATQRPSVDVITGVIKANLPTRVSFAVTSRIDSRTILGEQGAEQLLGKGDMLYKPSSDPIKRVHGPFVSDEEVEHVATYWRSQGKPDYVDAVTNEPEEGSFGFDDLDATASDQPDERKYRQVCQLVFENQKVSVSWLQRQMGVGYNTAAKWVERMEQDGYVGPANHVGRRDIYRDENGSPL
ncbi:DNA translocase FtsK 4TM domain-containing protein [Novosphingobium resinovorum]|uniref:DNA translocase FtsK n=1 Tax=Sphingomonadaceae TaxID=41297 RepID=UPI00027C98E0|nr:MULTISPECIES: DNA translocase FtsK [Sphingomonadaceae]EJU09841.1 DNA segregation ATPase FtsK/SpoIIIE [Sphingomonas sp. LH128]MBF7012690.1 DNA translocase FtsK 4TM domain-containing protein [Novosphingobium sp. HR1a]WJM27424.1 DNA translocase FtsK 4TM domain-containing protein [Novosphingobium resinovorum]